MATEKKAAVKKVKVNLKDLQPKKDPKGGVIAPTISCHCQRVLPSQNCRTT